MLLPGLGLLLLMLYGVICFLLGVYVEMVFNQQKQQQFPSFNQVHWERKCSICLEEYNKQTEIRIGVLFPCYHTMHYSCLQQLYRRNKSVDIVCPLCRCSSFTSCEYRMKLA